MRLRPRCISIGRLKGSYPLTPPTYQSGSLPDTLLTYVMGYLISRPASRLDAFSGYPIRTWSALIHTEFHVLRTTWVSIPRTICPAYGAFTFYGSLSQHNSA